MLGFMFALVVLLLRYLWWLRSLWRRPSSRLLSRMFSKHSLLAVREIFSEGLLHLRIYKRNRRLGFMHMSLALGWFMMIVGGKFETWFHSGQFLHGTWYAVFFRYFEPQTAGGWAGRFWLHYMDLGLLLVLTGLALAIMKRIRKRILGIHSSTRHTLVNRVALTFLWMIFPLRLVAEALTFGQHGGGGFLTGSLGRCCFSSGMLAGLELPLWWAYSLSLGAFFVVLPFSRYLHIPTEMALIFLRHWGLRAAEDLQPEKALQAFEIHACSACGLCLDVCPAIKDHPFQSAYFLRALRSGKGWESLASTCLSCGACEEACPINLGLEKLRTAARGKIHEKHHAVYSYLPTVAPVETSKVDVLLFTGCMGRLKPATTKALKDLLEEAGLTWVHLDEQESICCGRPLALAGRASEAGALREFNRNLIQGQQARMLVTTCPICLKQFRDDYGLELPVYHHSEMLWYCLRAGRLKREKGTACFSYHDPCELGRKSACYQAPRELLQSCGTLLPLEREQADALCCGNSLGALSLSLSERQALTSRTLKVLEVPGAACVVTACPLCQHNLARQSRLPVRDLAEVLAVTGLPEQHGQRTAALAAVQEL